MGLTRGASVQNIHAFQFSFELTDKDDVMNYIFLRKNNIKWNCFISYRS